MSGYYFSMSEEDYEMFETGRDAEGMSKSSFMRLLIAEHCDIVPFSIKYKGLLKEFSELNTLIKGFVISNKVPDDDFNIYLLEKLNELETSIRSLN